MGALNKITAGVNKQTGGKVLADRIALVTGGTSGIGEATAQAFAQAGAIVVISGRRRDVGDGIVASIIAAGGDAHFISCDLRAPNDVEQLVQCCLTECGGLDIAFNNAGVLGCPNLIAEETVENYNEVFETNVRGTLLCMKYQMAHLIGQGHGVIINNTSVYGAVGFAQCGSYVAAKHAIEGLTKVTALEGARHGVRVNAIAPGYTRTSVRSHLDLGADVDQYMTGLHPIGRIGEPSEVAAAAVFLASESASFITGASLPVDGGCLAQ
ncbi:SDR family oxidoreductase [Microvirga sp. 3-52]|uniref:SDR family NAD(P)-dependent oxidoreductase n=1 Tax=Microvirga sp. 3-52 TaxID=2792425 RepID=UPI001AD27A41|nr:SDR family oxidoreductase [Microvirga sp. 3-52]MBO1909125.1 SDR family oxidoreductase [Microvirga sp. 3-52]MBS7454990.1 SDR family oxidoreductase [Microvirga sp. 3-52]